MTIKITGTNTAAAPGITGDDTDTGLVYGTNQVDISTGGTSRVTVDSSGKIGIGITSPTVNAQIQSSGTNSLLKLAGTTSGAGINDGVDVGINGSDGILWNRENGTVQFATNNTERVRITSDGKVAIGNTSPQQLLHVFPDTANTTSAYVRVTAGDRGSGTGLDLGHDSSGNCHVNAVSNAHLDLSTNNVSRLRIDNEGQMLTCSTSHAITASTSQDSGTSKFIYRGHHSGTAGTPGSGNIVFNVWSNGNVESYSNSFGGISDVKLKENIVDANSQWNDIKTIKIRNYNFKAETGKDTHTQIGLVAQELETVCPKLVYETTDLNDKGEELGTTTKAINYSVLYVKAIKALQEAMTKIETLETKVAALEAA